MQIQLRRHKYVYIMLAVCMLLISLFYITYSKNVVMAYRVIINGEEIGIIEDKAPIEEYLEYLQVKAPVKENVEVMLFSTSNQNEGVDVSFKATRGYKLKSVPVEEIKRILNETVTIQIRVLAISIENEEVLYINTDGTLDELQDNIVKHFIRDSGKFKILSYSITENIELYETHVDPSTKVYSVEDAAEYLVRGTNETMTHKVSSGDSLWTIARRNSISVEDLRAANPQMKSDVLKIGQEINLVTLRPFINVETVEETTFTEVIPFNTQYQRDGNLWNWESRVLKNGVRGEKEVTAIITRENGQEVEREIISETIIKEPSAQVVLQGTRATARSGTGRFMWPTTVGRLTSPFGNRWDGFHAGVDVGASSGTPIYAADAGRVSFAGRQGNYGLLVIINHSNGYQTYYAHCSSILVKTGQQVKKGDLIARVGNTGRSTGPHLHFEVRRNGNPVNPMNFFR